MSILIIGGGKMGLSHLAIVSSYIGKKNVALCESNFFIRALFRALGFRAYRSTDKALKKIDKISGALIATPTKTHAELAKWAIANNIPCFIEKPLTLDEENSKELKTLAIENGVYAQVGFVMRYISSFQKLRNIVSNKSLGEVINYKASMKGNVITKKPSPTSWQGIARLGGGSLNEYGPHLIDLSRFIFGAVINVNNVEIENVYCTEADDRIFFELCHENNIVGNLEIDWCDASMRKSLTEFKVIFEHGEVRVDGSSLEIINHDDNMVLNSLSSLKDKVNPDNVSFYLRGEEFSLQLEYFLSQCFVDKTFYSANSHEKVAASLADGLEVDKIISLLSKNGGLV